jgi:hypothetical protein
MFSEWWQGMPQSRIALAKARFCLRIFQPPGMDRPETPESKNDVYARPDSPFVLRTGQSWQTPEVSHPG